MYVRKNNMYGYTVMSIDTISISRSKVLMIGNEAMIEIGIILLLQLIEVKCCVTLFISKLTYIGKAYVRKYIRIVYE